MSNSKKDVKITLTNLGWPDISEIVAKAREIELLKNPDLYRVLRRWRPPLMKKI
jgi:hypothetical protein